MGEVRGGEDTWWGGDGMEEAGRSEDSKFRNSTGNSPCLRGCV